MKRLCVASGVLMVFIAISSVAWAENTPSAMYEGILPKPLEDIVGQGAWLYHWPHGCLPLEPEGFELQSAPVDFTKGNRGMTKSNWGMPSIYKSDDGGVTLTARVLEYHRVDEMEGKILAIWPQKYWPEPCQFKAHDFHGLSAATGCLCRATEGDSETRRQFRLSFRTGDLLILLEAETTGTSDLEPVLLEFAEIVYRMICNRISGKASTGQSN